MSDPLRNGIKLIVAIGGFAAKPGVLSGLKAGGDVHDIARKMLAKAPPGLMTMADTLTAEAEATFRAMAHELPPEAPVLFEQMVEVALPDPRRIVTDAMDAERIVAGMLARHTEIEHTRAPMPRLFRAIVAPAFRRLLDNRSFADELTPAFMAEVLGDLDDLKTGQATQTEMLAELLRRTQGFPGAVAQAEALTLDDLKTLAAAFGETSLNTKPDLLDFLTKKAAEYGEYRAQIDALDERVAAISNLKGAAQDAAERLDFEEVENLLSRVDQVETEIAAETKEARARNALMRGRVEDAYRMLSSAADSFSSVDPLEPARRRILKYSDLLQQHGERFPGRANHFLITMIEHALSDALRSSEPVTFGQGKHFIACACGAIATRAREPEMRSLFPRAIKEFRSALEIFEEQQHAGQYFNDLTNLGRALHDFGDRTPEVAGENLLCDSIVVGREAVGFYEQHEEFARTIPNKLFGAKLSLASSLRTLGGRLPRELGMPLLEEARWHLEHSQARLSTDDEPRLWAWATGGLSSVLSDLAARTPGNAGKALFKAAFDYRTRVQSVFTKDAYPIEWAKSHANLALLEEEWAAHDSTVDPQPHLKNALKHIAAALTVFGPEHTPYHFRREVADRDRIAAKLTALDTA